MAETFLPKEDTSKDLFDADSYVNNPEIEQAWAAKSIEHMEVHYNLLKSVNPVGLNLTPHDKELLISFNKAFPDFKLDVLSESSLKSPAAKKEWNKFCNLWKDKIQDALFGTLIRIDCTKPYTEDNTIFVVRLQFLAIEVARNKLGYNNTVFRENNKK